MSSAPARTGEILASAARGDSPWRVTVVVPAYEEESLIGRTLDSIPPVVERVIVVDDASPDATARVVLERKEPRLALIRRPENGGVGRAIVEGYRAFLEAEAGGDAHAICVVMAGDAQMDPLDLPELLRPIIERGAGYTKGNRLMAHGVREVMPRTRLVGNVAFSLLTKIASGYWHVVDSQCGYTAITRDALEALDLDTLYPRYGFPNDLLVKLNVAEIKVADVPVRAIYGEERSGINPWTTIPRISLLLWRGFWWRLWHKYVIRDFHPLVLLYVFGLFATVAGMGLALWFSILRYTTGSAPTPATAILAALGILVGFQSVLFAMMFDMLYNQHLKVDP